MKYILTHLILLLTISLTYAQERYNVSSESEFESAHDDAVAGDSIVWETGSYSDVFMDITKDGLIVTADVPGTVVFNGSSRVEIDGNEVTLSELQFIGGDIEAQQQHVIRVSANDVLCTQINISDYRCYKYLNVDGGSRRATISYCNFENRPNLIDQNILSIRAGDEPGYHKIQYCSFKNFDGGGNDDGIEPIRIGVSSEADADSRTIVEYCYFTNCDGDGELISNKASQNVMRYNTFEDNTKAELVLRHGDEAIVYGNFFLNNMGGVRVREGSGHFIYNNYFSGLDRRSIYLQNESSDPLSDIHVYFNTIVNSAEMILGSDGSNPPTNVTIANNIFADPTDQLFEDATGNETWIGNISDGSLGISSTSGILATDPELVANEDGFYELESTSPAIDNAETGFPIVPSYEGLDYDSEILLDLMKQSRPEAITSKDIGAIEYSADVAVSPHATEENTGPFYLRDSQMVTIDASEVDGGEITIDPDLEQYVLGTEVTITAVPNTGFQFSEWTDGISGTENPFSLTVSGGLDISAEFLEEVLGTLDEESISIYPNPSGNVLGINAPAIFAKAHLEILSLSGKLVMSADMKLKGDSLQLDVSKLDSGVYLLEVIFDSKSGTSSSKYQTKFIKN